MEWSTTKNIMWYFDNGCLGHVVSQNFFFTKITFKDVNHVAYEDTKKGKNLGGQNAGASSMKNSKCDTS